MPPSEAPASERPARAPTYRPAGFGASRPAPRPSREEIAPNPEPESTTNRVFEVHARSILHYPLQSSLSDRLDVLNHIAFEPRTRPIRSYELIDTLKKWANLVPRLWWDTPSTSDLLRELEEQALQEDNADELERIVNTLCVASLSSIATFLSQNRIQAAADAAVGMVDVCLKRGRTEALNRSLLGVEPENLPPEIVLAFLTTTKPAERELPNRAVLVQKFETALRESGRDDIDDLMRFAR